MKLLFCEIENFGKFHRAKISFNDGITTIKADNGWGKSTLAAFLKCMFYGMKDGRTRSFDNERKKYYPWQGGAFGGAVVFSYRDKTYRVERTFGKTPAGDDTKIYDVKTGLPEYGLGDGSDLGERLFGLDKDGYARTAYFEQGSVTDESVSGDIKAKLLSAFNATGGDEKGVEDALSRLDEAEKSLRKRRPHQGKLDIIDEKLLAVGDAKNKLVGLKTEIQLARLNLQKTDEDLSTYNAKLAECERAYGAAQCQAQSQPNKQTERKSGKGCLAAYLVCAACIFASIFTFSFHIALSIVCLLIAAASAVLGAKLYRKNRVRQSHAPMENTTFSMQAQELEKTRQALEAARDRAIREKAYAFSMLEEKEKTAQNLQLVIGEENELLFEKAKLEETLKALKLAKDYLLKAQASLASKYLRPVAERAQYYLTAVNSPLNIELSADGNAFVKDGGYLREMNYFSRGNRDIVAFCIRLATLDILYEKEKPFLLFDDPFVNLDDTRLKAAKSLLNELSTRYQTVYFTCKN